MKARLRKSLFRLLVMVSLVGVFIPLYMYFSHDVLELRDHWPHIMKESEEVQYEIKASKPKRWAKLDHISRYARWAIIISEDWAFYQHQGIDVEQIKAALGEVFQEGRFRGASTITQQMVKNVYLSGDRTLWRKLHEFILAQKVEKVLTKDRILEIYLNVIEFGPDIYGIYQASYHYFRKHPSALTAKEGAFLAMLLPSPKRYYVSFKNKQLTPFARDRVNNILRKMKMAKVLSSEKYRGERSKRFSWERY